MERVSKNIIFVTLSRINSLEDHSIYSDLLKCFLNEGYNITIVSSFERRTGIKTRVRKLNNITFLDVISADILNKIIDIQNKNLLVKTTNRSNHKCDCGGPFAVKCINQKCGNSCHDDKCPRHR